MNAALLRDKRVAPSILSADYSRLGGQVAEVMQAGARVIHVDVMDGHFVPPITVGPLVVTAIREQVHEAGGALDVHLMIERPEQQIAEFAKAGADAISVHYEATPHVNYALNAAKEAGCLAGLAINPATPAEAVTEAIDLIDNLLCMTVNPGWSGQSFIPSSVRKVERLRSLLPGGLPIEVDGGIDAGTAPRCAVAGATLFVAGSAVFEDADPARAYREIAQAAGAV